jgi:hypothetical protein
MRLIYESDAYLPIVNRIQKEEINEDFVELKYKPSPKDRFVLERDDSKAVFLSSTLNGSYHHVRSFSLDRTDPGLIFFSNKPYLAKHEVLNRILSDETIKPSNVILIGQHVLKKEDKEFIDTFRLNYFSMKEISHEGCFEISESIMAIARGFSALYVLIDSNVLKYPIVRSSWVAGLSTRELIFFIQRFKQLTDFHSAEFIVANSDARLAVKVLAELFVPDSGNSNLQTQGF